MQTNTHFWVYVHGQCGELYATGSGVNRVQVVLSVSRMRLLGFIHVCMSSRYGCMLVLAVCIFEWVYGMVMKSAYVATSTGGCGAGMSEVYMLKRMGKVRLS